MAILSMQPCSPKNEHCSRSFDDAAIAALLGCLRRNVPTNGPYLETACCRLTTSHAYYVRSSFTFWPSRLNGRLIEPHIRLWLALPADILRKSAIGNRLVPLFVCPPRSNVYHVVPESHQKVHDSSTRVHDGELGDTVH